MTTAQLQEEIKRLKKEKDVCILAHTYQRHEITEIADYVGDSFKLSKLATETDCKTVILCGVRFMAETVKILSPEKKVILSADAGCPMAEQFSVDEIKEFQKNHPGCATVAYVNTTAELKTVSDVCVTSSSALKIVKNMENKDILFIPDCNLGAYVQKRCPEKNFHFLPGGCPVHKTVSAQDVQNAKKEHPNAVLAVHPECKPEVTEIADFVGSTSEIMDYARKTDAKEVIIGTELTVVEHLEFELPEKKFYPLSKGLVCCDMRLTKLSDVYNCLNGGGIEINLPEDVRLAAKKSIDEMIRLG